MTKKFVSRILALGVFGLVAACNHGSDGGSQTSHVDDSIAQAKETLQNYPTGVKVLGELNGQNPYGEPIEVVAYDSQKIQAMNGHDGGGIKQKDDGKYQIFVNKDAKVTDIAHAIAHELQHVKLDIELDQYMKANPALDKRFGGVHSALVGGTLSSYATTNKSDVEIYFKGLFFEEVIAYQVNFQLQTEGLPFSNTDVTPDNLGTYINQAYIKLSGYDFGDASTALAAEISKSKSFTDYLKANQ